MEPSRYSSDANEAALGVWIHHQRIRKKDNTAETWQIDYCNGIHGWLWEPRSATWFDNCAAAQAFKDANAGQLPNRKSANPEERRLGNWIHHQRKEVGAFTEAQKKAWKQLGA